MDAQPGGADDGPERPGAALKVVLAFEDAGYVASIRARLPHAEVVVAADDGLARALVDADALVCDRLSASDTAAARRLRLIQATSAGADRIDRGAVPAGCTLCNVHDHEDAIAEWALMAMLALSRRLLAYDRGLREGRWHRFGADVLLPLERLLRGRVLGTIGFGHIGRRSAELARALGMETVAVTRSPSPERAVGLRWLGGLDALHRLLEEADFALACLPLTEETRGLVGARELDALGPGSYLLNAGRGELVEERALYEALRDGRIAGAAIDTWYRYPQAAGELVQPSAFPFAELPNVLMTPHVSGRSRETSEGRRRTVAEQLARLVEGRPLHNVLS